MQENTGTKHNDASPSGPSAGQWYHAALGTAVAGGVFSIIVCGLLLHNFTPDRAGDLRESTEITKLKQQLMQQTENETLVQKIRDRDQQLRNDFFRRRAFAERGGYLLLVGVVVFLAGLKSALVYVKKLPDPRTYGAGFSAARVQMVAFWSVAMFTVVVGIGAIGLLVGSGRTLDIRSWSAIESEQAGPARLRKFPTPDEIRENWGRFRGPGGLGVAADAEAPLHWDGATGKNILWKAPIGLPGHNSPIVWGRRVFLTGATEDKREVYCFDGASGSLLWRREVRNPQGGEAEPLEVYEGTGYAASTAATDGRRVYAIFANGHLACYTVEGKKVWFKNLGLPDSNYGYSTSLAMYRDLLLVKFDQELDDEDRPTSKMLAFEASTGRSVWETPRPVPGSWSSPILFSTSAGHQLVTCGSPWVIAYDPATGGERWRAELLGGDVAPSPIFAKGLVFAISPSSELFALRADGKGNVTESHVAWIVEDGIPDICSPVSNGELVFVLAGDGLVTCYDAANGAKVWEAELDTDFQSSPTLVGGRLYLLSEKGVMFILAAGREFKKIGTAELGEHSTCSPAFVKGRIYIRGDKHLFCIGEE